MTHLSTLKKEFKRQFGSDIKFIERKGNSFVESITVSKEMPRSTKKGITFMSVDNKGNMIFEKISWF